MNVYISTKHKNKHSNCQPFDLFTVPVQESSDPPVDHLSLVFGIKEPLIYLMLIYSLIKFY